MKNTTPVRWLIGFLRIIAVCQLLAFIAVFVPVETWLSKWYQWLDLDPPPAVSAVLRYVVGGTAFFQGAIGIWLFIMISDPPRYRPMLLASAFIYLVAAPAFYLIDRHAGLPFWWRIYDFTWCLLTGTALLSLARWPLNGHAVDGVAPPSWRLRCW